jgi:hypothetical protein
MDLKMFISWLRRGKGGHAANEGDRPTAVTASSTPDLLDYESSGEHSPETGPAVIHPRLDRDQRIDVKVASGILDIGDLVESYDIRMQLAEALTALPGIEVLIPGPGEPFDRQRHRWEITEPVANAQVVGTVAYMISAGLAGHDGLLLRPARVAVYDTRED